MKKILFGILILTSLFFIYYLIFKNKVVRKEIEINDFSKSQIFILKPKKGQAYTNFTVHLRGNVDNTIAIGKDQYIKLDQKKIDTIFNIDYYGGSNATFYFYPYKATKGKLFIDMKIQ